MRLFSRSKKPIELPEPAADPPIDELKRRWAEEDKEIYDRLAQVEAELARHKDFADVLIESFQRKHHGGQHI